ncbi:MAG: sulfite exporter TauE/SafE family protein, partial [Candidatus Heimdallarchaeota archaeon]|nr:sulfite exporter TauE/SafE family protein [Candidatus Heimdallarchaeota archaeon]
MDPLFFAVLLIAGFFFGILSAMVGIGGGLLNVPFLTFVMEVPSNDATFISTFVIIFTSTSAALTYKGEKKIDYRTGGQYLLLALPGVIIGGLLADRIPREILLIFFAIMIIAAGIRGIIKANAKTEDNLDLPETSPAGFERRKIVDKDGIIWEYDVKIGMGRIYALLGGVM